MATPAQIAQQVQLEREAIKCGLDKLYKNERQLAEKEYASASVHGVSSIKAAQSLVAQVIQDTFAKRINEGKNGAAYVEIKHYLSQFNDEREAVILANIALKRTFDLVFSQKRKDSAKFPNAVSNTTVSIGASVEAECQMRWYEENDKELYTKIKKKYWLSSTGTEQKRTVMRLMMKRNAYLWDTWSASVRARLGAWLLEIVCSTTGWFEKTYNWVGKKSTTLITPTDSYLAIQEKLMNEASLFAPLSWPMLIEPNDWTNEVAGGYLLNEVQRGNTLVRRGDPTLRQPDKPLAFLNKLQKVAYQINPFIYEVAKQLDVKGYKIGKFKPLSYAAEWEIPSPPPDIGTNEEARWQYRKERTEAENNRKAYIRALHVRTTATMEVAKRFREHDRFYIPWSFDYRGRAYPIPAFLTPHDTDFGKSLLRFAEPTPMTYEAEDWLRFQCSTAYGLDKSTMTDRIQWARDNEDLISRIALDPMEHIHDWEEVEEPFQFIAACDELYHCVIACDRQTTSLCVATDATCSGLQILAGLARDKKTAMLVNVVPSDKPQDAYKTVAEAMINDVPEHLRQYFDRKITKKSVMTVPYNATIRSSEKYIKEAFKKVMPKDAIKPSYQEAHDMAKALYAAMDKVAPGPLKVMGWIGRVMTAAIKSGKTEVRWTTPSGFVVVQKRDKFNTERLELKLLGTCKFTVVNGVRGPDSRKHKSSGAPNLIHSLDASLLHLAFQRFDAPFSVIHDSVLCRATDMSLLSTHVRETYMFLFAENDYLTDFANQIGAVEPPPIIGDLEPSSVIESTYFFC